MFFANLAEIDCLITVTEMRDQALGVDTSSLFEAILDASRVVNLSACRQAVSWLASGQPPAGERARLWSSSSSRAPSRSA